jgi:hypothetical protein
MRKLHRRRRFEISMIAAAFALLASAPTGALAATEEPGSTPGEPVVESPGGSSPPAAPATPPAASAPPSTGWTPQSSGTSTSSGGGTSVRHGSSVGSGGASSKTGSTPEASRDTEAPDSNSPASSGYEPELSTPSTTSTPSTSAESASAPRAETGSASKSPPAGPAGPNKAVEVAVDTADPVVRSEPPRADNVPGEPVAADASTDSGTQASSDSSALPLLVVILVGLALGYVGVRLWRIHQRRRIEALKRQRSTRWRAVVRQIETERTPPAAPKLSAERQKVDVA